MLGKIQRLDMNFCVDMQLKARGLKVDAGETAAYARELEYLQAEAIREEFPEYTGLTLVPLIGNAIPPGAKLHTYREIKGFGEAELLEAMAPEDFPTAEVQGTEVTGKFRSVGSKYVVTIEDLRASALMQTQIDAEKASNARQAVEGKLDRLILSGGGPFKGLLDDTSSIDDTSSDDWTTGTEAGDVTAILATFRRVVNNAFVDTKGLYKAFDFVVSTTCWTKLGLFVPSTTAGGGMTVMDFLLKYVPGVRSISHNARLDAAGASGKDRMLAFPRDPKVLDALVPIRFEQFAPQLEGMQFTTYCHAKFGGIRIKKPKAVRRVDITIT